MDRVFIAGEVAGLRLQLAHLGTAGGANDNRGPQAVEIGFGAVQFDKDAISVLRIVAINEIRLLQIHHDHVHIAIAIQVRVGRTVSDALVVQPPILAGLIEVRPVGVAVRAVDLLAHFPFFEELKHVFAHQHVSGDLDVGIVHVTGNAVGEIQVLPAIVVEIAEFHRPCPVGAGDAVEPGGFLEAAQARVDEEGILHVLGGCSVVGAFQIGAAHDAHGGLGFEVGGGGHVGHEEIREQVIVHIAEISPHCEPRHVGHRVLDHVGEGAIAVVAVEAVGSDEIVGHVNVLPSIHVVVPPSDGESIPAANDTGGLGGVFEDGHPVRAVAFVVVNAVRRALGFGAPVVVVVAPEVIIQFRAWVQRHAIRPLGDGQLFGSPLGVFDAIGQQVHVQLAIAIIVRKGCAVAAIHGIQARLLGGFLEDDRLAIGTLAHVDEELVGHHIVADVNIHSPISIHIRRRRPRRPGLATINRAGGGRDVFEFQISRLAIEEIFPSGSGEEHIRFAIAIEVRNGHPTSGHPTVVKEAHGVCHIHFIEDVDPRVWRIEFCEQMFSLALGGWLQWRRGDVCSDAAASHAQTECGC